MQKDPCLDLNQGLFAMRQGPCVNEQPWCAGMGNVQNNLDLQACKSYGEDENREDFRKQSFGEQRKDGKKMEK